MVILLIRKNSSLDIMALFLIIASASLTFTPAGTEKLPTPSGETPSDPFLKHHPVGSIGNS